MTKERTVVLTLPEDAFKKLLDGSANADILASITAAFQAASGQLDRKEARKTLLKYLDMSDGQAFAPVADVAVGKARPQIHIQNF
jgi:hypothetical protein